RAIASEPRKKMPRFHEKLPQPLWLYFDQAVTSRFASPIRLLVRSSAFPFAVCIPLHCCIDPDHAGQEWPRPFAGVVSPHLRAWSRRFGVWVAQVELRPHDVPLDAR